MIRSIASKAALLALAATLGGSALVNCSSSKRADKSSQADTGSVSLALEVAPGVTVNGVGYTISGGSLTSPIAGSVDVSGQGATVSFVVAGIPAGTGYTVALTATSTDGRTTCAGTSTPFDVVAGQISRVAIVLSCRGPAVVGGVAVNTSVNNCPTITGYSVAPLSTAVGGTIALAAAGSDADAGSTLAFGWTATSGALASGSSASTTFTCTAVGPSVLSLTVSDGTCTSDAATIEVACTAAGAGGAAGGAAGAAGGAAGGGEAGAGGAAGGVAGAGGAAGGAAGAGGAPGPTCGNGLVEAGETCDPPATGTCDATCQTIGAGGTGGSAGGAGGSAGGAGGSAGGAGGSAGGAGGSAGGAGGAVGGTGRPACDTCIETSTSCAEPVKDCSRIADAAGRAACQAMIACYVRTGCYLESRLDCLCGSTPEAACISGTYTGACAAEVVAATQTAPGPTVVDRFVDPAFPSGVVNQRISCEFDYCADQCLPQ